MKECPNCDLINPTTALQCDCGFDFALGEIPDIPVEAINHIPHWVKRIVAVGVLLFFVQLPAFPGSLSDAIQKRQAEEEFKAGSYPQAAEKYRDLFERYPSDIEITKNLGLANYHAGHYIEALSVFENLQDVEMSAKDVEIIDAAIEDIISKLNLNEREVGAK